MDDHVESPAEEKKRRSKGLLIATTVYGLLYLWFVIFSFIPAPGGSWISTTAVEPFNLEGILIKVLFLLFVLGYVVVRRNELIGGAIFVLWWVAMWGFEIFVTAPIKGEGGDGIAIGFPLFVLGVLFVWRGYKGKRVETISPLPE